MKKLIIGAVIAVLAVLTVLNHPTQAIDVFQACSGNSTTVCKASGTDALFGANSIWTRIINTLIFVIGAVAVIMIIIGGLRYVLSNGDSSAVTSAKNTILYAIIGLIIAILSYSIVNFVLSSI